MALGMSRFVDDLQGADVVGFGEGGVGGGLVAKLPVVGLVVRHVLVNLIRARGTCEIHDRWQFLEVRFERLRAILRSFQALADDHRVGLAHIVDFVHGDGRMRRHHHGFAILGVDGPAAGQVANAVGLQVRAGEHRHHALCREGGAGVETIQLRPCVRRASEHGVGLTVGANVVRVATRAGNEAGVFLALDGCADAGFVGHYPFLLKRSSCRLGRRAPP